MVKVYTDINVYDAAIERLKYVFEEFDNVLVAFSGGKDSGVLLNLAYDYAKENNMLDKLAMYHLDYEAQYQATTDYVTECFESYPEIKKYWLCLPIAAQCAINMEQDHWIPWDRDDRGIWVRDIPNHEGVINEDNVPFPFIKGTWDYDTQNDFCQWYASEKGKTATLIGNRTDESLNRQASITSK